MSGQLVLSRGPFRTCPLALNYSISPLASVSKADRLEESEVAERKTSGRQKWHLRIAKSSMIIACICDLSGWRGETRAQLRTET